MRIVAAGERLIKTRSQFGKRMFCHINPASKITVQIFIAVFTTNDLIQRRNVEPVWFGEPAKPTDAVGLGECLVIQAHHGGAQVTIMPGPLHVVQHIHEPRVH